MNPPIFAHPEFWNDRYGQVEFAYGTEPNLFLQEVLPSLPNGQILFPAEGEGRNVVWAARQGWVADAFDFSEAGQQKAFRLAQKHETHIHYEVADLLTFETTKRYDALALIFVHLSPEDRQTMFGQLLPLLKPGGTLILEGFHPLQIGKPSGGPNQVTFCYTEEELRKFLSDSFIIQQLTNQSVSLTEGTYHNGSAHTVRLIATRK